MGTNLLLGYMDEYVLLVEILDVIYPDSKIQCWVMEERKKD